MVRNLWLWLISLVRNHWMDDELACWNWSELWFGQSKLFLLKDWWTCNKTTMWMSISRISVRCPRWWVVSRRSNTRVFCWRTSTRDSIWGFNPLILEITSWEGWKWVADPNKGNYGTRWNVGTTHLGTIWTLMMINYCQQEEISRNGEMREISTGILTHLHLYSKLMDHKAHIHCFRCGGALPPISSVYREAAAPNDLGVDDEAANGRVGASLHIQMQHHGISWYDRSQ